MGQAVENDQEYWRPPRPEVMRLVIPGRTGAGCRRCGADYSAGARFCHICGSERDPQPTSPANETRGRADSAEPSGVRSRFGFSMGGLAFFVIGIACMIIALATGVIYKTGTLADWQAMQIWRIEWLLGASAALLAAILLKRPG
jgi:hypothetical protein